MQIGIDISAIVYGTGVSVYTKNLVKNLLLIDKDNQYLLFGGSLRRGREIRLFVESLNAQNLKSRVLPISPTLANIIWNKLHILSTETILGKLDVYHSSDWTQPPSKAFKITTIHDLSPILYPQDTHPKIVNAHRLRLVWVKKEADRVIVPSQTTAKDASYLGIDPNKIRIIPEAVDVDVQHSSGEVEKVKIKYKISGKYILAVGVTPRKNIRRLIEAHQKVKKEFNTKLVVIGHQYLDISAAEDTIFTGFISQFELAALYSGAEVLAYPSLYEGYGLPILEAFSYGIPVVTSNVGSMAELASIAGVLIDPLDVASIAKGIKKAIENRKTLVQKGYLYVGQFSWDKSAKETLKVYKESLT